MGDLRGPHYDQIIMDDTAPSLYRAKPFPRWMSKRARQRARGKRNAILARKRTEEEVFRQLGKAYAKELCRESAFLKHFKTLLAPTNRGKEIMIPLLHNP